MHIATGEAEEKSRQFCGQNRIAWRFSGGIFRPEAHGKLLLRRKRYL